MPISRRSPATGSPSPRSCLTLEDTEARRRHLNARATFAQLLGLGAVPVVNENDTIATSEIRFGDNDRLAARVAQMVERRHAGAAVRHRRALHRRPAQGAAARRHLALVAEIGPEIEAMAGEAAPGYSSGGMVTKLAAARIAMNAGCRMLIARGAPQPGDEQRADDAPRNAPTSNAPTSNAMVRSAPTSRGRSRRSRPAAGRRCFCRAASRSSARKAWIAGTVEPSGTVIVDDGAARALRQGRSLLPAGVVAVEGNFERGDAVIVRSRSGAEAGRGLSAYSSADIRHIAGHKSGEIAGILGYRGRDEIIHRDDLVVTERP